MVSIQSFRFEAANNLVESGRSVELPRYKHNKALTAFDIIGRIENWPTAWGMRLNPRRQGLRLLRFRDGFNVVCRGGTRDWDVIHELLFAHSYERAFARLSAGSGPTNVLDLGGNIGLFSLLAARANPSATIHVFEPGPQNLQLLEVNRLLNPDLGERIHIRREAVSGNSGTAKWFFDDANPGGSSLFATAGSGIDVQLRAFAQIVESLPDPIGLVKIDIEGAEYEVLEKTPTDIWQRIPVISLELHVDPQGAMSNDQFLDRMKDLGYRIEPERVCSFFLSRD